MSTRFLTETEVSQRTRISLATLRRWRLENRARFNVLKRSVPGISQKMLTQCLRQLERSGLVVRRVLTESPVGVEYSLTKLGETLEAPVAALYEWTGKHSAAVRDAQKSFDAKNVTTNRTQAGSGTIHRAKQ
jgi:DNA-binding HxlR family transcriptional regulator